MTCAQAKEFLSRHGVPHVVRDIWADPAARAEFDALGFETVPVVVQGDRHMEVGHVDQLAEWLGMPPEDRRAAYMDLADACDRVLKAFEQVLRELPHEHIMTPTPNRGRDMRDMTHNIFTFMAEATRAIDSGRFSYRALHDDAQRTIDQFKGPPQMEEFARDIRERWRARALQVTPEEAEGLVVTDARGEVTQLQMLDVVARHAAGHLRQAYVFMRQIGIEPTDELTDAQMAPIAVQSGVY